LLRPKTDNTQLYQIFSSEIDFRRDDVLSRLSQSGIMLNELINAYGAYKKYKSGIESTDNKVLFKFDNGIIKIDK
jgi:hypothetical protein